jgi:hypothetical protein
MGGEYNEKVGMTGTKNLVEVSVGEENKFLLGKAIDA